MAQTNIIPQPASYKPKVGYFILDTQTSLRHNDGDKEMQLLVDDLSKKIKKITGTLLPINRKCSKQIEVLITRKISKNPEAYQILVTPKYIKIRASSRKGLFYAFQTFIQTLPPISTNEEVKIACFEIKDTPAYQWRGFMLDVSRHYFTVEAIKEILDVMALYKMNVFHWHLTDNEGWRIEIKKYPRLTSIGAFRTEYPGAVFYKKDTSVETGVGYNYGGFYTQEQAKEIVAYAALRNIEVIPEIEMPGHSGAALAAYPQFSCSRKQQPVPNAQLWSGKINTADMNLNYCVGNDSSFVFLQDILQEIMAIFPSKYIHIGGDEVDKTYWQKCTFCQEKVKEENLKDEAALQGYFIRNIQKYLLAKGKLLIGWDEILDDELLPSATIMSWRGEKGGIKAAQGKYQAIMTPSNPLYLNRYQADPQGEPLAAKASINTLEKVYQYNPIPTTITDKQKKFIIGGQAAIWTEFIASLKELEYMLLPRLPAIAEVLWTASDKKNWATFIERLNAWHYPVWQDAGIRFNQIHFKNQSTNTINFK